MNASYRWHDEFVFSKLSKKKLSLKGSNVKYWVTEAYDEIPSSQNLAVVKKVLVFEDPLPLAFLVGDSQNVHEDRLLEVYYDSEFDQLKQVLLVDPVSMKKSRKLLRASG